MYKNITCLFFPPFVSLPKVCKTKQEDEYKNAQAKLTYLRIQFTHSNKNSSIGFTEFNSVHNILALDT